MVIKFKSNQCIIWNKLAGNVIRTWFDGQENRCEIYISKKSHRGYWTVKESSIEELGQSKIKEKDVNESIEAAQKPLNKLDNPEQIKIIDE